MSFIKPEQTAPADSVTDPETGETVIVVEHFRQGDHRYRIVHNLADTVRNEDAEQRAYRSWTPLAIKRACGERWPEVKTALQAADIYEDFIMAQELREDDPAFLQGRAWAEAQYGAETVEAVLAAAGASGE